MPYFAQRTLPDGTTYDEPILTPEEEAALAAQGEAIPPPSQPAGYRPPDAYETGPAPVPPAAEVPQQVTDYSGDPTTGYYPESGYAQEAAIPPPSQPAGYRPPDAYEAAPAPIPAPKASGSPYTSSGSAMYGAGGVDAYNGGYPVAAGTRAMGFVPAPRTAEPALPPRYDPLSSAYPVPAPRRRQTDNWDDAEPALDPMRPGIGNDPYPVTAGDVFQGFDEASQAFFRTALGQAVNDAIMSSFGPGGLGFGRVAVLPSGRRISLPEPVTGLPGDVLRAGANAAGSALRTGANVVDDALRGASRAVPDAEPIPDPPPVTLTTQAAGEAIPPPSGKPTIKPIVEPAPVADALGTGAGGTGAPAAATTAPTAGATTRGLNLPRLTRGRVAAGGAAVVGAGIAAGNLRQSGTVPEPSATHGNPDATSNPNVAATKAANEAKSVTLEDVSIPPPDTRVSSSGSWNDDGSGSSASGRGSSWGDDDEEEWWFTTADFLAETGGDRRMAERAAAFANRKRREGKRKPGAEKDTTAFWSGFPFGRTTPMREDILRAIEASLARGRSR